ncbi:MAG: hypothetical protein ACLTL2_18510 [Blautia sp.]
MREENVFHNADFINALIFRAFFRFSRGSGSGKRRISFYETIIKRRE